MGSFIKFLQHQFGFCVCKNRNETQKLSSSPHFKMNILKYLCLYLKLMLIGAFLPLVWLDQVLSNQMRRENKKVNFSSRKSRRMHNQGE